MNRFHDFRARRQSQTRLSLVVAWYVLLGAITAIQFQGPGVVPDLEDNEHQVSGVRAKKELISLLGPEQAIHDAGSEANALVRVRLIQRLVDLELEVTTAPFTWEEKTLVNVVARRPGSKTFRPILICSHYDSCKMGPGAGDALSCVASIIETIRCVQTRGSGPEVWFLFTDGEEGGLLGAQEFVSRSLPWGESIPFVLNFDARGTQGAAPMFETTPNNVGYVPKLISKLAWPRYTNSLMNSVYDRLPNKTDYTVFKEKKWPGFNFALIAGAHRYHTPLDTPEHLSDLSLQHYCEHGHALLEELSKWTEADWVACDSEQGSTHFDLMGYLMVAYSNGWNATATVLLWFLFLGVVIRFQRFATVRPPYIASLFSAILAVVGLSTLLCHGLAWLMKGRIIDRRYIEYGEVASLGYTFIAFFVFTTLGSWAFRKRNVFHARLAILFWYCVVATYCTLKLPGASYLFHWPGFLTALTSLAFPKGRLADSMAMSGSAIFYAPLLILFAIALGPLQGLLLGASSAILLVPVLATFSEMPRSEGVKNVDLQDPPIRREASRKNLRRFLRPLGHRFRRPKPHPLHSRP